MSKIHDEWTTKAGLNYQVIESPEHNIMLRVYHGEPINEWNPLLYKNKLPRALVDRIKQLKEAAKGKDDE